MLERKENWLNEELIDWRKGWEEKKVKKKLFCNLEVLFLKKARKKKSETDNSTWKRLQQNEHQQHRQCRRSDSAHETRIW